MSVVMDNVFRPRRRPMLRLALALTACAIVAFSSGMAVWLRRNVVPPDCEDARTLALVRQSLIQTFRVPSSVTIDGIQTHAGGYLAFRFACEATLGNINPNDLPPGTTIPGFVYYTSRLTPGRRRHEVSVSIEPVLILEKVQ